MSSPPANSLLNLLNPYASVAQSSYPRDRSQSRERSRDPLDSPSNELLRELQSDTVRSPPTSPTPTPRSPFGRNPADDTSSDDEPPPSLLFQTNAIKGKGRVTSPSPGPWRRRPSNSSSSTSRKSSPERTKVVKVPLEDLKRVESTASTATASTESPSTETPTPSTTSDPPAPPKTPPTPGPSRRLKGRGKHKYHAVPSGEPDRARPANPRRAGLSDYNQALWAWANVVNLDAFLQEVYEYYKNKGYWCIVLAQVLNLITIGFVIGFFKFLTSCVDYGKLLSFHSDFGEHGRLNDVLVNQCMARGGFFHWVFFISGCAFFVLRLLFFIRNIPRLNALWRFYTHLLGVQDSDIQTMPWPTIVHLVNEVKKDNPVTSLSNGGANALATMVGRAEPKAKLDAHDIANRVMRQENYLIALFNKDLLDLRVRIPVPASMRKIIPPSFLSGPPQATLPKTTGTEEMQHLTFGGNVLTLALEHNLRVSLFSFVFGPTGEVRKEVVHGKGRRDLVTSLQRRFVLAGLLNLLFAPVIVLYILVYSFFRYFEEYHKNPSSMGGRQYTLYAQWKFREFNELPHLFERRLNQSYPIAKEYIDQFPKERTALIMRFVAFVAGAFAAVLAVVSILDTDLALNFEITPHRSIVFYLGIFGIIMAVARGMIPEDTLVFDPEYLMREVVRYTHYLPHEWEGKLHSPAVLVDFGQLFALKVMIFVQEIVSVLLTPFILWFSLAPSSGAIIDFFREFTVHVEDLGFVCSFAVFDFHRPGNIGPEAAAAAAAIEEAPAAGLGRRLSTRPATSAPPPSSRNVNDYKMEKSFLHFKATNPDWQPSDPASSVFLDRLMAADPHGGQPATRAGGSMYHGGRGLGLGVHPSKILRSPPSRSPETRWHTLPGVVQPPVPLATMAESNEDDGEAEAMGWNRRVDVDDSVPEGDRGLLRGAGILLQQVMNR
ncbi:uncharacterized protein CcaverHIS019_0110220 [Cutaneotrichosporon cavernicola]|uniref:Autophagy-related protein 9 n=1 Tax=Cutaneotrichosporon cavernicola TaxID=279322 RepID=A0AA48I2C9_9TREE|nr:uncharacterized protein CcaverHIS019_0110220 [Cutaneotrichosporon cavernicola]BEI88304.1 hypothetical protein CcaverHIS019_0110220 [Cutaneotrichosporon cavernicola]BEI96076.1 hypothetical protein CcaverHIS631_0110250 [Cutaneotrichosporon cavernicola]BEJ03849.1 hypothetical protein CcaverHIS641_0110240 [Cutaneotrichosporon cavernicola]